MRALSRAEVRDVDRRAIDEYGMSGLVLMENAGRGCAQVLFDASCRGPVAIVCGKGNNGGDGFVIARHLDRQKVPVKVVLLFAGNTLTGDAAANFRIIKRAGISIADLSGEFSPAKIDAELSGAEWIVDALLGIGASGEPRFPLDAAIAAINRAKTRRLAVDLPSGLDCDTGQPAATTVLADHTCTFVAEKLGFANPAAARHVGQVHIIDIGAPRRLLDEIAHEKAAP
jgi:NAD(P)H-hydrate epimerase